MMMQKRFEAAFRPPNRHDEIRCQSRFEALPRKSASLEDRMDELVLSEVHSKLDRVLNFMQDIGYMLLDDAAPRSGGGLALKSRSCKGVDMAGAHCDGSRLSKVKNVENEYDSSAEELEMNQETPSTAVARHEEIRYSPDTAKYAHYPDDLVLVWRFATLLSEADPDAGAKVNSVQVYKTVLQGVRQMHLCQYSYSDIVVTLAYASVYFQSVYQTIGHKMSVYEVAFTTVLLIYLAHSFVLDETCPLHSWQQQIFRKYCSLKVLDAALFRLFRMRKFCLRITEEEEKHALSVLLCSSNEFNVILSLDGKSKISGT